MLKAACFCVSICILGWLVGEIVAHDKKVVCYYGRWSVYRWGAGKCDINDIDPKLCTHLIYTFTGLSENGQIQILDPWADLPDEYGLDGFRNFKNLTHINTQAKVLVAVGGWNEGNTNKYSRVFNNPALRKQFVASALNFLLTWNYDGLDMDWEYPNQRGGLESDKEAFIALLKELKEAFQPHGLLLTSAVAAAEISASKSYIIPQVNQYLDFINIMAYDLHGPWDKKVGFNAPLYPSNNIKDNLDVEACVNYWISQGADPNKLILGIPLYGRTFRLTDQSNNKPGAPASGTGMPGKYTNEPGMIGYNEILAKMDEYTTFWDNESMVPYMVKGNDWITYDNDYSVYLKARYALEQNLGGVMVWSVETDDLTGISGQKFTLLHSINEALDNEPLHTTTTTEVNTATTSYNSDTSTHSDDNTCKSEGWIRDVNDCNKFYFCKCTGGEQFVRYNYECPENLYYNTELNMCDYPENVPGC